MTVSPNRRVRNNLGRKTLKKNALGRQLRMESLERRDLMAADFAPFHNYLAAADVNGDFMISPLDALVVINQLNASGSSNSLSNRTPPVERNGFVDVNGDNILSPLDALVVINAINSGEGLGELAEVKYEFYALNDNGTLGRNLDPNPNDSVSEAVVNKGEKFVVRTLMTDLRSSPAGVFSAYHDLNFVNGDSSNTEKMKLLWSEYNNLKFVLSDVDPNPNVSSSGVLSGSFKLQYGSETTATINIARRIIGGLDRGVDEAATAANIQTAIQALSAIGSGNVVVQPSDVTTGELGHRFDIFYRNARARQDIVNPTVVDQQLAVTVGTIEEVSISSQDNPSPSQSEVARGAFNYRPIPTQGTKYLNGQDGTLDESQANTGNRAVRLMGGFSNTTNLIGDPFLFFAVMDTSFLADTAGVINVFGTISALPSGGTSTDTTNNLGIALYNAQAQYLTAAQVVLPSATITIRDLLTAVDDPASVNEDSATTSIVVTSNDTDRNGLAFGVVGVTQPSVGGNVTFAQGAQSVQFTPSKDYNGVTTFTYTIRNTNGNEASATVTVTVNPINDPPIILDTTFDAIEDQTLPLVIAPTTIFSPGPPDEADQTITLSIVSGPTAAQGTAIINVSTGNLEFSPAKDFFGTVNFTVRGTDSGPNAPAPNANATNAVLTITVASVNDAPIIVGTTFSIAEDATTPLTITNAQLFTPGPANESSQTVTLAIVNGPLASQGTATLAPDGRSLQFLPAPDFFGPVLMRVRGTDNGSPVESTESNITISVTPVNDAPNAVDDTAGARFVAIGLTGTPSSLDVMRNDDAGPGETTDTILIVPFTTSSTALGGTVSLNAERTRVIYTPPVGAVNVVDTFTYTIQDSGGLTDSANVEVFVFPPVLPFAIDESFTIAETPTQQTNAFDVLRNDLVNTDATPRLVSIETQPESGKGTAAVTGPGDASDRVIYTAPAHFFGTAVIKYRMTDSEEDSDPVDAFLTVRVTEVNDPPVAVERRDSGLEDNIKTISGSSITTGLSRGPFEDFQTLTVTNAIVRSGPGTLVLSGGDMTFTPLKDFFGDVIIEYTVTDNGTTNGVLDPKSATGTLILTIEPVNDAPVPSPKSFAATEDIARQIAVEDVIAGDTVGPENEADSQSLSFVDLTGPITTQRGGTVTQNGDQLLYTPAADFNGVDSFTYQITDGQEENQFATGTVTLNVSEVNDEPVANNIRKTVFAGVNSVIDVTAELAAMSRGAANEASQTLLISRLLSNPNVGAVQSVTGTTVTYFAPLGTDGTTSFVFEVIDNGTTDGVLDAKTSSATFTIEILPFIPSSLKGIVFIDDNANGVLDRHPTTREPLELPIGGVEVTISYADPANPGRSIIATEMTEADGSYDFELLPPGTYTVSYSTPLLMTNGSSNVMSYTRTIAAPGDVNALFDFPVLGIVPEYGSHLEYLASSFYNHNGTLRSRGMYAAINADGITDWTSRKDGFEQDRFHELVLSADGTRAYLTAVRGDGQIYTATLVEKRQFIRMQISNGSQLVRVLASSSDLTWIAVNPAAPPVTARGYLETVDDFFLQEGWDWDN